MFENLKTGNIIAKLVKLARVSNTLEEYGEPHMAKATGVRALIIKLVKRKDFKRKEKS